jgi:hypothetical protein
MSERIAGTDEGSPYGGFAVELTACLLSVDGDEPVVLLDDESNPLRARFPSVAFDPEAHDCLNIGVRAWLAESTGLDVGSLEQVHTARRHSPVGSRGEEGSALSIGFLGLVPPQQRSMVGRGVWRNCLEFMPWEDRRRRGGLTGHERVGQALLRQVETSTLLGEHAIERQMRRIRAAFGIDGAPWDEAQTLERFSLLYAIDPQFNEGGMDALYPAPVAMVRDHLQILSAAMGRLRSRLRVRPIAVDLVPPVFTLLDLQRSAEAILGPSLHKQNFRRYVEGAGVIEATGTMRQQTGGRPAQLFRFRREGTPERRHAPRRHAPTGTMQRA